MQIHDLLAPAVADDDEQRSLVELDAILDEGSYARVHFLAHRARIEPRSP